MNTQNLDATEECMMKKSTEGEEGWFLLLP
jgi:hypothetical protein